MTNAKMKLTGYLSEKKYPELFRHIKYYNEENEHGITFLSNAK